MNRPELLSPAGNIEKVKWSVRYGADAIYIGGDDFSLRANAINFDLANIKLACDYCHEHNVKLYVAINIVFHDKDIDRLDEYLLALDQIGVDALIMSDVYAIKRAVEITKVEVHLSTQASVYNLAAADYYESLGVKRIVLARECTKETIKDIIDNTNLETEVFIHGAMCSGFSGRCSLSNVITNRDANHGGCSQVCRFDFDLYNQDQNITADFPFSIAAKDLMMAQYLKDLMTLGVTSLKIEGRMRSIYYIAVVTGTYRRLIDQLLSGQDINSQDLTTLSKCANREAMPQFYQPQTECDTYYNGRMEVSNQDFLGIIMDYNENTQLATIEERNAFKIGDHVTIISPKHEPISFVIEEMYDDENNYLERANHPHQIIKLKVPIPVSKYDIMHQYFE